MKGVCDFVNEDQYFYKDFSEVSDFTYPLPCPLKPGTYEIRGYAPSLKNIPNIIMHGGDYMGETSLIKGGKVYWRAQMFVSVINIS